MAYEYKSGEEIPAMSMHELYLLATDGITWVEITVSPKGEIKTVPLTAKDAKAKRLAAAPGS